jgi:hypothetical protein
MFSFPKFFPGKIPKPYPPFTTAAFLLPRHLPPEKTSLKAVDKTLDFLLLIVTGTQTRRGFPQFSGIITR